MKRHVYIFIALMIFAFASVSFAAGEEPPVLKVGDTIPDFTLHVYRAAKLGYSKVMNRIVKEQKSFDKDIKGKSKVIGLLFFTECSSAGTAEMNLLGDLSRKSAGDFKAYGININRIGEIIEIPYRYPIETTGLIFCLSDPELELVHYNGFGFRNDPALVIADGDGKILFTKELYSADKDVDMIIKAVKDALKEQGVEW